MEDARLAAVEIFADRPGHFLNFKHLVHEPGGHSAFRHAVIFRGFRILHQGQAAGFFDRPQTLAAIRAGSRQHNTGGIGALIVRQAAEEHINRPAETPRLGKIRQLQTAVLHRQAGVRRDQIDIVRLDHHSVADLTHGHGRAPAEQFGQHALMIGVKMLDQNVSEPAIRRRRRQEVLECFQAAGRGSHPHDGTAGGPRYDGGVFRGTRCEAAIVRRYSKFLAAKRLDALWRHVVQPGSF